VNVRSGVVTGLAAGAVAAGAMGVVHRGLTGIGSGVRQPKPPAGQPGEANEDDATVKVADGLVRWLLHRPLPEDAKPLAGHLVHYAFGAGVGALYGGTAAIAPRVTVAAGLPLGIAVWLGAHVVAVPALGLAEPPTRRPRSQEARELLLHLVYGVVTETVRRLARRVR
jgi:putative membrane protein